MGKKNRESECENERYTQGKDAPSEKDVLEPKNQEPVSRELVFSFRRRHA